MADMEQEIKLLRDRMSTRTPVLVLGAGFSRGVLNGDGKPLPTGRELANELFDVILEKNLKKSSAYLEEYREDRGDLKKTCDNIREEHLVEKRDAYITNRMRGCHCTPDDRHMLLKCYPWRHIFTLNVDDFLEYLYESSPGRGQPNIHIKGKSRIDSEAAFYLYKLHGSVRSPYLGYVFDSQEYREHIVEAGWPLQQFGQLFLMSDVIFLGTEFQEEDLWLMIEKYVKLVEVGAPQHYFFISPEIHNRALRRSIESNSYMHHIPWQAEKFLGYIKKDIQEVEDLRRKMRDYGAIFYDEKKQEAIRSPQYGSELYYGMPPRPLDFFQSMDIVRPELQGVAKSIVKSGGDRLVVLYGKPYVGKTCAALRVGVDLMGFGYEFLVFNLPHSMDARTYGAIILEYLERMPEGTKVAVLAENMPYFYHQVKQIMKRCPKKSGSFVFLCTATTADHMMKKYLLDECKTLLEFQITEKTASGRTAQAIYDKLEEKNHLNKLRRYGGTERECVQYIRQVNDIIDVLYIAQEGRGFVGHFSEWINRTASGKEWEAFLYLNVLLRLGIPAVSKAAFLNLLTQCEIKISLDRFLKNYDDTVQLAEDNLSLRCSRLLWDSVKDRLDRKAVLQQIANSAKHISRVLKEGDETLENTMFQKLIKANNLHRLLEIPYEEVVTILLEIENSCKHLSYYWVQRGIANREIEHFEEANNAFSEAATIRDNASFHIKHAQAKNYMQWGLWSIEHQPGMATTLFGLGKDQMETLIQDAPGQYYAYSVHTYVDMTLRFCQASGLSVDYEYLALLLQKLLTEHNDKLNAQISKKFLDFCAAKDYTSSAVCDLKNLYKVKFPSRSLDAELNVFFDSDDLAD